MYCIVKEVGVLLMSNFWEKVDEKLNGINVDRTLGYLFVLFIIIGILFIIFYWIPNKNIENGKDVLNTITVIDKNSSSKDLKSNDIFARMDITKIEQVNESFKSVKFTPFLTNIITDVWQDFYLELDRQIDSFQSGNNDTSNENYITPSNMLKWFVILNKGFEICPSPVLAGLLIKYWFNHGSYNKCISFYEKYQENRKIYKNQDINTFLIDYYISWLSLLEGNIDTSIYLLKKIKNNEDIKYKSYNQQVNVLLGLCYMMKEDYSASRSIFNSLELSPINSLYIAETYFLEKKYSDALEVLTKSLETFEKLPPFVYPISKDTIIKQNLLISTVYANWKLGNTDEAFALLNKANNLVPKGMLKNMPVFYSPKILEAYYHIDKKEKIKAYNSLLNLESFCKPYVVEDIDYFSNVYGVLTFSRIPPNYLDTIITFLENNYPNEKSMIIMFYLIKGITELSIWKIDEASNSFNHVLQMDQVNKSAINYLQIINSLHQNIYSLKKEEIYNYIKPKFLNDIIFFPMIMKSCYSYYVMYKYLGMENYAEQYIKRLQNIHKFYDMIENWSLFDLLAANSIVDDVSSNDNLLYLWD